MSNRWWRAYDKALDDPKVQGLPPPLFKFWFNLLCVASENDGVIPPLVELKQRLKARLDLVKHHTKALLSRGLIEEIDGHLEPHNWRKLQYKSDNSTDRVRAHRNGKRNVSETPPDTESDTESDKKEVESASRSSARTKSRCRLPEGWQPDDLVPAQQIEFDKFCDHARANGRLCADWQAAWRNWQRLSPQFNRPQGANNGQRPQNSLLAAIDRLDERLAQRRIAGEGSGGGTVLEGIANDIFSLPPR